MPKNPFEQRTDPRYRAMTEAMRLPEQRVRTDKIQEELENAYEQLALCKIIAEGYDSKFWKLLLENIIDPNTSSFKILQHQGEKRTEACGEVKAYVHLKRWVEDKVKQIPRITRRIEGLQKQLDIRRNQDI